MKTKFTGKLRKEMTLLRKTVCAFLLPGEILLVQMEDSKTLPRFWEKSLQIFSSDCFPSWPKLTNFFRLKERESRLKEVVFSMPALFPFTQVESNGKAPIWCPLVMGKLRFPTVLSMVGRTSLSFWWVDLFVFSLPLKMNAILHLEGRS